MRRMRIAKSSRTSASVCFFSRRGRPTVRRMAAARRWQRTRRWRRRAPRAHRRRHPYPPSPPPSPPPVPTLTAAEPAARTHTPRLLTTLVRAQVGTMGNVGIVGIDGANSIDGMGGVRTAADARAFFSRGAPPPACSDCLPLRRTRASRSTRAVAAAHACASRCSSIRWCVHRWSLWAAWVVWATMARATSTGWAARTKLAALYARACEPPEPRPPWERFGNPCEC